MAIASLLALFSSFIPGSRMVDGGDCLALAKLNNSAFSGLTALAGGGQVGATLMQGYINEVSVSGAGGTDSVQLPIGLAGLEVTIINDTANSIQVFGNPLNPNTGVGDTIAPANSAAQAATATGVSQAANTSVVYSCFAQGKWKKQS